MIGRHIIDGDLVVLERGPDPRNGQIVAALVDGEAHAQDLRGQERQTVFEGGEPKIPDLIPAQELVIQGVFKALIRKAD
jgi:repressor LexA